MQEIDPLLRNRHVEPPRAGFEARIVAAAAQQAQLPALTPMAWLRKTCNELMLPSPQVAFAVVLVLGLAIGFSAPAPGNSTSAIDNYLSDDGAIL